jgi:hypothetical protein
VHSWGIKPGFVTGSAYGFECEPRSFAGCGGFERIVSVAVVFTFTLVRDALVTADAEDKLLASHAATTCEAQ